MSSLSLIEKQKLERELGMSSGYVLGFSNRTFDDFSEKLSVFRFTTLTMTKRRVQKLTEHVHFGGWQRMNKSCCF